MTDPSPPLSPEVLNRLLIGRELLRSFGPNLTPQSDALTVARGIMTAQDAAELISSAIAEHLFSQPKDRAGLPEYIESIEKVSNTIFPGRSFFNALNRARVSFKHHGALPNVTEFHRVLSQAADHLDQACLIHLGVALSELDLSLLIADIEVRALYTKALDLARSKKYREVLEALMLAMNQAEKSFPIYVGVGQTDSEIALQLTAYGVDPGAFIRLQQFLPMLTFGETDWEPKWEVRTHGHPANWRKRNVEFCLSTFLDLVLKLQHAEHQPSAVEFSILYDDIVSANYDGVQVQAQLRYPFSPHIFKIEPFGELKAGERIKGHLIPAFKVGPYKWERTIFDAAELYVMERPFIETGATVPENTVLIVDAQHVTWSYEEREGVREQLPHFFDAEEE